MTQGTMCSRLNMKRIMQRQIEAEDSWQPQKSQKQRSLDGKQKHMYVKSSSVNMKPPNLTRVLLLPHLCHHHHHLSPHPIIPLPPLALLSIPPLPLQLALPCCLFNLLHLLLNFLVSTPHLLWPLFSILTLPWSLQIVLLLPIPLSLVLSPCLKNPQEHLRGCLFP
jgi:hypothetical protein